MSTPLPDVTDWIHPGHLRLQGVRIGQEHVGLLNEATRLTLVSCKVEPGILRQVANLEWLIIARGGGETIGYTEGCGGLQYLEVNQVRGLRDLSAVQNLTNLRRIDLYGLPQVTHLPDMHALEHLRRLEVGSMKGLTSLEGIYKCPNLTELLLTNKVGITEQDYQKIHDSTVIQRFSWNALDGVPDSVWMHALEKVSKPAAAPLLPEDWF